MFLYDNNTFAGTLITSAPSDVATLSCSTSRIDVTRICDLNSDSF